MNNKCECRFNGFWILCILVASVINVAQYYEIDKLKTRVKELSAASAKAGGGE